MSDQETEIIDHKPRKKRREWAPYLLILPSILYLAFFFAWPMARGLILAVWDDDALLTRVNDQRMDAHDEITFAIHEVRLHPFIRQARLTGGVRRVAVASRRHRPRPCVGGGGHAD